MFNSMSDRQSLVLEFFGGGTDEKGFVIVENHGRVIRLVIVASGVPRTEEITVEQILPPRRPHNS